MAKDHQWENAATGLRCSGCGFTTAGPCGAAPLEELERWKRARKVVAEALTEAIKTLRPFAEVGRTARAQPLGGKVQVPEAACVAAADLLYPEERKP